MIDTEFEKNFLRCCRKYGLDPNCSTQGELHFNHISLDKHLEEDLMNKKVLVWLKNNQTGLEYGLIRNQVYLSAGDTSEVYLSLKLTFEEVFHIWEAYDKGSSLEWIYTTQIFHYEDVPFEHLEIALWTLHNGNWNYILNYLNEDSYDFDFKKYLGRY